MDRRRHPPVPKTTSVIPGAGVNIVLKADQPTGRTVSGVVRDVLTRGDHPRGIKVRLSDGRVGRVQSMLPAGSAPQQSLVMDDGDDQGHGLSQGEGSREGAPEANGAERSWRGGRRGGRRGGAHGASRGRDEEGELPSQQIGLDAYMRQPKPKRKGKGRVDQEAVSGEIEQDRATSTSQTVTCPVCSAFEGDEEAVSHHVAGHFE